MVGASLFGGRAMAGDWSHGSDSSCAGSSQEDPVHLRWDRIYFQANGAGYGNARGANYENDKYWSATGSGSSTSYFNYNDGSGCNNQAQWSSNHAAVDDGSHVREWHGCCDPVRGAAHHDVVTACFPNISPHDTSDNWNSRREMVA
jgi:hypothetical protein